MINDRIIGLIFHPKNPWAILKENNNHFFRFVESTQKIKAHDIDNYFKETGIRDEKLVISTIDWVVDSRKTETFVTIKISHDLFAAKIKPIRDFYEELFKYKNPESLSKCLTFIPDDIFLTEQARVMLKLTAFYRLERMKQRPGSYQFIG